MKICHINLARGFSGGESQTLALIKEQVRRGYDINVVAKSSSPFAEACLSLGCKVFETSHFLTGHSKRATLDVDHMHVHEGQAVYWALIQHLLFGVPYIITRRIDNPLKDKWLSSLAYRHASTLCGVSRAIQKILRHKFPDASTQVVHDSPVAYPIDATSLQELEKKYDGKFLVIQAAKMHKHKGYDVTISAAKILEDSSEIYFCLLGDGPEMENLKSQAEGLINLEFMGLQKNMGTWFARADTVVLPSHTEGMGSVLLEATLAGVPVIGTRAGGIPDAIMPEVNGLLIDTGNPQQLADAILRLKRDSDLQSKIQAKAPAFIEGFDIRHAADMYESLYQKS